MKRKLFSAILFGALLTASTSGLTSCKDYDDDIQNLQSQIDKLATAEQLSAKVTELQGQIEKAKADAVSAADAAKKVGEAAQKSADDAASAAAAAKKAAEDIAASAATKDDLKAAADAAQKAVEAIQSEVAGKTSPEDVKAAINAALTDVLAEVEEHHNAILELDEELNGEGGIAERLAAAEQAIEEGAAEVDLAPIKQLIKDFEKKAQEILGTAFEMVTSVDLYTSKSDTKFNPLPDLRFWQVTEKANVFPKNGETGDDKITFVNDAVKLYSDSLLIRVSPVDAKLDKSMISLINSQGATISSDLVEVEDVVPYNRDALLTAGPTTRSTEANGLWVVKFKAKDNFDADAFAKATTNGKTGTSLKYVLFAVAVNNTAEAADSRRVISAYDVTLGTGKANYAWDFDVDGTSVADIHNRYIQSENGTANDTKNIAELVWLDPKKPGTEAITEGDNKNAVNRPTGGSWTAATIDNRQNKPLALAEVGKKIEISYPVTTPIKGFYVTLDHLRAVESGVSEINAWNSYKYENVGTYKADGTTVDVAATLQEGNNGYIMIKDLANMSLVGDIIGFRVFAVNLDGTLVDPDGRAFYVGVGAESNADKKTLDAQTVVAKEAFGGNNKTAAVNVADAFNCDWDDIEWTCSKGANGITPEIDGAVSNDGKLADNAFDVLYLKEDGKTAVASEKDAKTISINLKKPMVFVDDATYKFTAKLYKNVGNRPAITKYLVRTITVDVTKALPVGMVPYYVVYNALQDKNLVMTNAAGYTVGTLDSDKNATGLGEIDLTKFLVYNDNNNTKVGQLGITEQPKYWYEIENSAWDASNKVDVSTKYDSSISYKVSNIANGYIDGTTEHRIIAHYTYSNIRLYNDNGSWKRGDYNATSVQTPTVVFTAWSTQGPGYAQYKVQTVEERAAAPGVTRITYLNNQVEWIDATAPFAAPGPATSFDLDKVLTHIGIKSGVTTVPGNSTTGSDLKTWIRNDYLKVLDCYTIQGGVKNPYFTPTIDAAGKITFTQKVAKTVDHEENLVINVVDCHNNKTTITVPIRIVSSYYSTVTTGNGPNIDENKWSLTD